METKIIVIKTTIDNKKTANDIATKLIKLKLAACVQIKQIESIYNWKNKLQTEIEYELSIKTSVNIYKKCQTELQRLHPYDCPQIISLIANSNEKYYNWLKKELNQELDT